MGVLQRVSDAVRRLKPVAYQERTNFLRVNALCSAYENTFSQVRALVNEMKLVVPYGVTARGKRMPLASTPELARLMDPNDDMGWAEFIDACFVTWLTEDELDIHVWKNKTGRVYGFSVLPPNCRQVALGDAEERFLVPTNAGIETLYRDEVMVLRFSRSPQNLDKGVSPASAVFTWSQIDDLMAQYQKALLENGAVPATITKVRAKTRADFEEKVKELQRSLKGAKNRNKTIYVYEQELDTGETASELDVKVIQGTNSTLAIKDLISIVNDRMNKAFGTSNFVLGDDSSATYNNAELSDRNFTKRRVYPALVSFWSQFQHELNRITGGLGYGISFDLEIPELTDRLKTKAETAQKNVGSLISLLNAGSTPTAAVRALQLDDSWNEVALNIYARALPAGGDSTSADKNKNLPASHDGIVESQSEQSSYITDTSTSRKLAEGATKTNDAYFPIFKPNELNEQHIYNELQKIAEALAAEEDLPLEEVKDAILETLLSDAQEGSLKGATVVQGLVSGKTAEALAVVVSEGGFKTSQEFRDKMAERVDDLVNRYAEFAREKMRDILADAPEEGRSAAEIERELKKLPEVTSVRAEMIARNETVNAFQAARLETDKQIAREYGLKIRKIWRTSGDDRVCPECEAMEGQTVDIFDAFPEHIHSDDGVDHYFEHSVWNNGGETCDAHVNCRCYFDEEVVDD